jgi:hypothetical protein
MQSPGVVGGGEAVDPFGGGGERDAVAGSADAGRQADGEVGFAGAGRPEEHDDVACVDEVEGAEVGDHVAFEKSPVQAASCGDDGTRTHDPLLANQVRPKAVLTRTFAGQQ